MIRLLAAIAILGAFPLPVAAAEALIAVAANFRETAERLEAEFEQRTGHTLTIAAGSTGKLYAQIANGAPFDVLLAADQERPERLENENRAVAGSRFTYVVGRLALWSADPERIGADGAAVLHEGAFRRLAIANPDLAPYGAAATEVLASLGASDELQSRLVMGENVGQTFALIASGNAELGFVALSYVLSPQNEKRGSYWEPDSDLYSPIKQDAVLLQRAASNDAAIAFLDFLKSDEARAMITGYGYGAGE